MKKILFFFGISLLFFSCKKEKIGTGTSSCYGAYEERSTPLDLSVYDSVKWVYDHGTFIARYNVL